MISLSKLSFLFMLLFVLIFLSSCGTAFEANKNDYTRKSISENKMTNSTVDSTGNTVTPTYPPRKKHIYIGKPR